jgi:glycosyltransferase involved in cell wall biosynthesis
MNLVPFKTFDAVIVNQGGWKDLATFPFSFLFSRIKNYFILYHNYNPFESVSNTKSQILQEWAIGAKKNLCATKRIFETMENVYHIPIPNQKKLFNPLTIEIPDKTPSYPPLLNGHYKFSVLAALDIERKAQDILVESFTGEQWKKRNWELHFYGEGKDKEHLKRLVHKSGLDHKIFIHGNARDYTAAISSSHLVLQITHLDAMPISVIEAMAMAKPLVISDVGDMPLWVKENKNGWISPKVTKTHIGQTMDKAWENRSEWEEMGKASFEIFKKQFPQDPVAYFLKECQIL